MSINHSGNKMVYLRGIMSSTKSFGAYRKVLHLSLYSKLVAMEIPEKGDTGKGFYMVDQVLVFTHGSGRVIVSDEQKRVKEGDVVIIPAGISHQLSNVGDTPLRVMVIYSPAEHGSQSLQGTKEQAEVEVDSAQDEPPMSSPRKTKNKNLRLTRKSLLARRIPFLPSF